MVYCCRVEYHLDVFELLFVRQQESQAYRGYIESLTDYWVARAELAHVVGIGLPKAESKNDSGTGNSTHSNHGDTTHH